MGEKANATSLTTVIYPQSAVTFALVFCIVFIILGIIGNVVTIAALLRNRKLRSAPTSTFIISLSVTDLIFCIFNLPITAVRYAHQKWLLGGLLCKLFPFFFYLNVAASLFNMTAVTINRYVLITHYTKYDKIYKGVNVALMISLCWFIPLSLLLPTMAEIWGRFGYSPHTFSCTVLADEDGNSPKKIFFLIGFFLPIFVIILCYTRIYCVVKRSRQTMATHNGKKTSSQMDERALTRMVLVIFCAFLICYMPLMAVNVFDDSDSMPTLHVLASVLAWSASVINPFIYGLMSSRYRQAYLNVLPCGKFFVSNSPSCSGTGASSTGMRSNSVLMTSVKMTDSMIQMSALDARVKNLNEQNKAAI